MLLSAMRSKREHAGASGSGGGGGVATPVRDKSLASSSDVVAETPQPAPLAMPTPTLTLTPTPTSTAPASQSNATKKQRSIHDFFSSGPASAARSGPTAKVLGRKRRSVTTPLVSLEDSQDHDQDHDHDHDRIQKRIDYDTSSMDGDGDSASASDALSLSQSSDLGVRATPVSGASLGGSRPPPAPAHHQKQKQKQKHKLKLKQEQRARHRPRQLKQALDFGGICPSSQRSEPDVEPVLADAESPSVAMAPPPPPSSLSLSQSGFGFGYGRMFSQDDMDFCTPQDQPVMHLSHPTTPSPIRKRQRLDWAGVHAVCPGVVDVIRGEDEEEVQHLTQDLTHMGVQQPSASRAQAMDGSPDSADLLLTTPQRAFLPGRRREHRARDATRQQQQQQQQPPHRHSAPTGSTASQGDGNGDGAGENFTNPFAPIPPSDARKRRSHRKRQSFPPTWGSQGTGSVPYSRYLSDFVEQELVGSGSFSKVYKCVKKIDGWAYAIKKSKRHFRGRADTERALREVQALAALSGSRHVVQYFDAWIEDELLYIQLEHCQGCSLAAFVDKFKPHHVPEETLGRVLCHLAQALRDLHSKRMVHMDVKIQNVLMSPGPIYKLGDLGTVALADGSMEITEGDNRYLSRELLEGNRSNLRAGDIFALGATVYELALGSTLPNGGEEWQKIRDGDLTLFRQYSNSLQHLIASMMHPDPLQRPAADEILQHEVVLPFL